MDIKTYKANLKQRLSEVALSDSYATTELVGNANERAALLDAAVPDLEDIAPFVEQNLKVAADKSEAVVVRTVAIRSLKEASFLGAAFGPYLDDFHSVLRDVAQDRSSTLRSIALRTLAVAKDSFAYDVLLKGLRREIEPLVPEEKAIQYLAYDEHSSAIETVRDMFADLGHRGKENALRMMASDKGSESIMSKVMADKTEKSSLRRLGAAGLKALSPSVFKAQAEKIIQNDTDFDEIKAICVTALTNNLKGGRELIDDSIVQKVKDIRSKSRNLKSAVKRFVDLV